MNKMTTLSGLVNNTVNDSKVLIPAVAAFTLGVDQSGSTIMLPANSSGGDLVITLPLVSTATVPSSRVGLRYSFIASADQAGNDWKITADAKIMEGTMLLPTADGKSEVTAIKATTLILEAVANTKGQRADLVCCAGATPFWQVIAYGNAVAGWSTA